MADGARYTEGTGIYIATDDVSGYHYQKMKLDGGADGQTTMITGTTRYGLTVDVRRLVPTATPTRTTVVAQSSGAVTLLAANANRRCATIMNDSVARLCVALGSAATLTNFTEMLDPRGYYEIPCNYTGIITGIWTYTMGAARITELEE